ncbi:MAG: 50S ribosomal protein L10 [Candidatus Kapabacteria bacterium]|nr:50S ribosomal protein L10 [Candidatus Kapabacteria bacterium]
MTKEQKQQVVAELTEQIKKASALYFVDFATMTVEQDWALRRLFREKGIQYRVAKNTLILRALNDVGGYEIQEKQLFGQTAVVFAAPNDPISPAKIIRDFSAKDEKPKLKVAVVEGAVYPGSDLKKIADFPTREEIIAGILGSINAPVSGIVGAINSVMRDLASVIEEAAKKRAA